MIINNLLNNVPPLAVILVDVEEFGLGKDAQIAIREFDAKSASDFNEKLALNKISGDSSGVAFYAALICACAIDDKGEKILKMSDAKHIAQNWKFDLLAKVGGAASELNGFTRSVVEDTKKPSARSQRKPSSRASSRKPAGHSLKSNDGQSAK